MISEAQRIQKWLRKEAFIVNHFPYLRQPVCVTLLNGRGTKFSGWGNSISKAAQEARRKREGK